MKTNYTCILPSNDFQTHRHLERERERERERESVCVQRKKTWVPTKQEDPSSPDSHPEKEDPSLKPSKERVLCRPIPLRRPIPHRHRLSEQPTPEPIGPP